MYKEITVYSTNSLCYMYILYVFCFSSIMTEAILLIEIRLESIPGTNQYWATMVTSLPQANNRSLWLGLNSLLTDIHSLSGRRAYHCALKQHEWRYVWHGMYRIPTPWAATTCVTVSWTVLWYPLCVVSVCTYRGGVVGAVSDGIWTTSCGWT